MEILLVFLYNVSWMPRSHSTLPLYRKSLRSVIIWSMYELAVYQETVLTICTSLRSDWGWDPLSTLEQMNSTKVGSGSPMYSIIFLFIHGLIRFSINVCGKMETSCCEKWRRRVVKNCRKHKIIKHKHCLHQVDSKYYYSWKFVYFSNWVSENVFFFP